MNAFYEFVHVIARLRAEDGCPWDREQTHASLKLPCIEEAAEVGVSLDYIVPEEGSNVWFDGWVIPKYAKNVQAATYFINFMCRPDIAIRNMEETGYVSANGAFEVLESQIDESSDLPELFLRSGSGQRVRQPGVVSRQGRYRPLRDGARLGRRYRQTSGDVVACKR